MHQAHTQGAHTGYSNEKMVPNDQKLDEIRLSHVQSHAEKYEIDEGVGAGGRIEFSTVLDHFFVRISSVGSLWPTGCLLWVECGILNVPNFKYIFRKLQK